MQYARERMQMLRDVHPEIDDRIRTVEAINEQPWNKIVLKRLDVVLIVLR